MDFEKLAAELVEHEGDVVAFGEAVAAAVSAAANGKGGADKVSAVADKLAAAASAAAKVAQDVKPAVEGS